MNPARIAIIVVAVLAAVVLALVVHTAFKPKAPTVIEHVDNSAGPPMTRVLAAKADLAVGDRLSVDNMVWQPWPTATLNAAYITDGSAPTPKPQGAAGAVNTASTAVTDIAPIEPITAPKIVRGGDSGYMAVRLPSGMRAMSVPVSVENGAGGFIQPGDRIDVVSSHPDTAKNGGGGMVTEVVLSNVKVLAVDQHTDTPKAGTSMLGATLTLEVPVADVEAVARAKSAGGALVMALRSYADIGAGSRGPGPGAGQSVRIFRGSAPVELVNSQ